MELRTKLIGGGEIVENIADEAVASKYKLSEESRRPSGEKTGWVHGEATNAKSPNINKASYRQTSYSGDNYSYAFLGGLFFIFVGVLGFMSGTAFILNILVIAFGSLFLYSFFQQTAPEREARRIKRREAEKFIRETHLRQYRQLRKEIEAMPQYEHWRHAVFEKFDRKCIVPACENRNLEVDHRKSFYAIVREHGITNTIQAAECVALWDVNNGRPLCKPHHDQTLSSIYRRIKDESL